MEPILGGYFLDFTGGECDPHDACVAFRWPLRFSGLARKNLWDALFKKHEPYFSVGYQKWTWKKNVCDLKNIETCNIFWVKEFKLSEVFDVKKSPGESSIRIY